MLKPTTPADPIGLPNAAFMAQRLCGEVDELRKQQRTTAEWDAEERQVRQSGLDRKLNGIRTLLLVLIGMLLVLIVVAAHITYQLAQVVGGR